MSSRKQIDISNHGNNANKILIIKYEICNVSWWID